MEIGSLKPESGVFWFRALARPIHGGSDLVMAVILRSVWCSWRWPVWWEVWTVSYFGEEAVVGGCMGFGPDYYGLTHIFNWPEPLFVSGLLGQLLDRVWFSL